MYVKKTPRPNFATFPVRLLVALGVSGLLAGLANSVSAQPQVIRNITEATQRLELTVNTSRILTLDKRVPKMVVNNPELVSVTPISANQVQIAAKKPGVTQINLWDEDDQVYTVDLMIYGDVRELEHALKRLFPESSLKVIRLTNSLVLEGFVERPEAVSPIVRLAEDYAPKIVNNITVGGVQQILLKVKVMEVSRTKLRNLGVDWAQSSGTDFVTSGVSGLLSAVSVSGGVVEHTRSAKSTFAAFVADGDDAFLGVLEALQENKVAKVLADPTITAVSGRPAHFNVGGEVPIPIPQGLNQVAIEYKKFGTQVDFVPIVLGNGNIRLEVRPRVSELDESRGEVVGGFNVPGFTTREVDTAVELKAGQTLALAGLVQTRIEAQERGLPFLSDLPIVGAGFRSVREQVNEIELLILVTPEFVDGMEPHEVPLCGPGMESVSPTNCQLYWGGHLEVPACGQCGPNGGGAGCGAGGCQTSYQGAAVGSSYISDGGYGSGSYNNGGIVTGVTPTPTVVPDSQPSYDYGQPEPMNTTEPIGTPSPNNLNLPPQTPPVQQPGEPRLGPEPPVEPTATGRPSWMANPPRTAMQIPQGYQRPALQPATARSGTSTPGLMGPIGYDVE